MFMMFYVPEKMSFFKHSISWLSLQVLKFYLLSISIYHSHTLLPLFCLWNSLKKFFIYEGFILLSVVLLTIIVQFSYLHLNFIPWYFKFYEQNFQFSYNEVHYLFLYDICLSVQFLQLLNVIVVISHSKMKLGAHNYLAYDFNTSSQV